MAEGRRGSRLKTPTPGQRLALAAFVTSLAWPYTYASAHERVGGFLLVPEERAVMFSGRIGEDTAADFSGVLAKMPDLRLLVLDSPRSGSVDIASGGIFSWSVWDSMHVLSTMSLVPNCLFSDQRSHLLPLHGPSSADANINLLKARCIHCRIGLSHPVAPGALHTLLGHPVHRHFPERWQKSQRRRSRAGAARLPV